MTPLRHSADRCFRKTSSKCPEAHLSRINKKLHDLPVEFGGLDVAESVGSGGGEEEDVGRDELVALHPDHVANLDSVPFLVDERALAHHPRYPVVDLVVRPVPLDFIVSIFERGEGEHADQGQQRRDGRQRGDLRDELQKTGKRRDCALGNSYSVIFCIIFTLVKSSNISARN